jgi:hypothetical protein
MVCDVMWRETVACGWGLAAGERSEHVSYSATCASCGDMRR